MANIVSLLQSLPKSPSMRVMHFSAEGSLCPQIQNFYSNQPEECEYLIATFTKEDEQRLQRFQNSFTEVKYLNPKRPRFHMQSKLYDALFISVLPDERIEFFKKVYSALKNAAPLFILINKGQKELAKVLETELIESNYVATNRMELGEFYIVSARKMHGWGGN